MYQNATVSFPSPHQATKMPKAERCAACLGPQGHASYIPETAKADYGLLSSGTSKGQMTAGSVPWWPRQGALLHWISLPMCSLERGPQQRESLKSPGKLPGERISFRHLPGAEREPGQERHHSSLHPILHRVARSGGGKGRYKVEKQTGSQPHLFTEGGFQLEADLSRGAERL